MLKNEIYLKRLKSILGVVGLVLVLVAVLFVNEKTEGEGSVLSLSSEAGETRGIASAHPDSLTLGGDQAWQNKLVSKIAQSPQVPKGRSAGTMSPVERLLFGELKGHYVMGLKGQLVHDMVLKQDGLDEAPQFEGKELSLLEEHRPVWWIPFEKTGLVRRTEGKTQVALLDAKDAQIGEAEFHWDSSGRLLSLTLQKH